MAVISLALGIGANAAIFSLFDQILLRPLPVAAPQELVNLGAPGPKPGSQSCNDAGSCEEVFSHPMFRDLEREQQAFTGIAAHFGFGANLAFQGQTMSGSGMLVSGSYFPVLGLKPALGRLIGPEDDRVVRSHFVAVLSHAYWQNRFGGRPDVVGETLIVNGQSMTILGVAPRGFKGTTLGSNPHVFVPITMRDVMIPGWEGFDKRRAYWAYLFARLRPEISIDKARQSVNVPYRAIINDVEAALQEGMSDPTLERFRARQVTLEPGARGQSSMHGEARGPLVLLLGVTAVVLLIACANIANLLLIRAASRGTELAVRLSIGASRRHVVLQLLTESCLLGILGGLGGLLMARWTLGLVVSILPPDALDVVQTSLDWRALAFAAALSIGTGLLFGLFPAISSTRPDLVSALRAQSGLTSGARSAGRFRATLATAQMALSMALLVAAGLFVKSLMNVTRVDLGLSIESLATFGVSPELNGYEPERSRDFFERLEAELAAVPGVTGVTASMVPLIAGSSWGNSVSVEGFEAGPDTNTGSRYNEIGAGFFGVLKIPLMSGREFVASDVVGSAKVALVNEAFARKFNLGRDAVGKWMHAGGRGDELDTQIVGLVQDAKYSDVKDEIPPQYFVPYRQNDSIGSMNIYVRAQVPAEQSLASIRDVVAGLDANLPVDELKTMEQQVRENVVLDRLIGTLSAAFAVLATVLAAVGLYGVLAYTITQRRREIGLRMALGLGRLAGSMLYELEGHDPFVLAVAAVLLLVVAAASAFIPARQASRIDPMYALRYE